MAANDLSGIGGAGSGGITSGPGGTGITYDTVTTGFKVEYKTLTLADIAAKYVLINTTPSAGGKVKVAIKGGLEAFYSDDFLVDAGLKQVQWSGTELDGKLEAGDKLQITYFTA